MLVRKYGMTMVFPFLVEFNLKIPCNVVALINFFLSIKTLRKDFALPIYNLSKCSAFKVVCVSCFAMRWLTTL